jgi:hypothetical protein
MHLLLLLLLLPLLLSIYKTRINFSATKICAFVKLER